MSFTDTRESVHYTKDWCSSIPLSTAFYLTLTLLSIVPDLHVPPSPSLLYHDRRYTVRGGDRSGLNSQIGTSVCLGCGSSQDVTTLRDDGDKPLRIINTCTVRRKSKNVVSTKEKKDVCVGLV